MFEKESNKGLKKIIKSLESIVEHCDYQVAEKCKRHAIARWFWKYHHRLGEECHKIRVKPEPINTKECAFKKYTTAQLKIKIKERSDVDKHVEFPHCFNFNKDNRDRRHDISLLAW